MLQFLTKYYQGQGWGGGGVPKLLGKTARDLKKKFNPIWICNLTFPISVSFDKYANTCALWESQYNNCRNVSTTGLFGKHSYSGTSHQKWSDDFWEYKDAFQRLVYSTNILKYISRGNSMTVISLAPCTTHNYWRICQVHQSWECGLNVRLQVLIGWKFSCKLTRQVKRINI
jgi:hypothetical protein